MDKAASYASFTLLKKQRQEKRLSKPIDLWTEMASTVAGSQELAISTAFSQVLLHEFFTVRRHCILP